METAMTEYTQNVASKSFALLAHFC